MAVSNTLGTCRIAAYSLGNVDLIWTGAGRNTKRYSKSQGTYPPSLSQSWWEPSRCNLCSLSIQQAYSPFSFIFLFNRGWLVTFSSFSLASLQIVSKSIQMTPLKSLDCQEQGRDVVLQTSPCAWRCVAIWTEMLCQKWLSGPSIAASFKMPLPVPSNHCFAPTFSLLKIWYLLETRSLAGLPVTKNPSSSHTLFPLPETNIPLLLQEAPSSKFV